MRGRDMLSMFGQGRVGRESRPPTGSSRGGLPCRAERPLTRPESSPSPSPRGRGKARSALSPRLRFEVFKRDGFRCVYCGASAPGVVLHADHVEPLAGGGADSIDNLVTACAGCNGGKGAVPLSVPASAHTRATSLDRARLIAEIDDAYNDWLRERRERADARAATFTALWNGEAFRGEWSIGEANRQSVRYFAERLLDEELRSAMYAAIRRIPWPGPLDPRWTKGGRKYAAVADGVDRRFRYFCGCCHKMIRERGGSAP